MAERWSSDEIYLWITMYGDARGFNVKEIDIANRSGMNRDMSLAMYTDILEGFVRDGLIERFGKKRGWYKLRETKLELMDLEGADPTEVQIWMPMGLNDIVEIYPNTVILIAGAPNSGKTALILNIIKENRRNWDIHYFNSEMSAQELRKRLDMFDYISIDDWEFKAYSRSENFHEVIQPGPEKLNIVDFLEVYDDFYNIGHKIKKIHDALDGGVAVVALQKNPGSDTGLGGFRTLEVTRLALAVDYGKVKIVKAKNWKNKDNPNGLERNFKLVGGCQIIDKNTQWRKPIKEGE